MSEKHVDPDGALTDGVLTVKEVAVRLRVKPSWVYLHATELGALRVGKYLRFQWTEVLNRLSSGCTSL